MSPLVSIVVPVYNLEFYLERCLASLEAQTFGPLEVLVVNDGATDDSQLIIDEFVARRPDRFRPFIKANGGHGSACNYGIERAQGRYVMIVDGDDFLEPHVTGFMHDKIEAEQADILIGNLLYVFSGHTEPYRPLQIATERLLDEDDVRALYSNWPTPCGRLYRKSLFDADPELRFLDGVIFADANFVPKSYLAARRIYYVNRELYHYDITRPTQSLKQTDKRILDVVPVLRDMLEYYRRKGAFKQREDELRTYVTRHCVAWVQKIRTLTGYSKEQALREVFAVADDYFGNSWVRTGVVYGMVGRAGYWRIRLSRRFGYAWIARTWRIRERAIAIDRRMEAMMALPLRAYRALASRIGRRLASAFA